MSTSTDYFPLFVVFCFLLVMLIVFSAYYINMYRHKQRIITAVGITTAALIAVVITAVFVINIEQRAKEVAPSNSPKLEEMTDSYEELEETEEIETESSIEADIKYLEGIGLPEELEGNPEEFESEEPFAGMATAEKPVIYLYPERKTEVTVELNLAKGNFSCTYPKISNNKWTVTAQPNGTLTDSSGQTYNYLFWEAESDTDWSFDKGFCVSGSETATFLENKLHDIGLSRKEANEFITYWLPQMQDNPYNVISFQTKNYREYAKLAISPKPDHVLRVFMAWYPSNTRVEMTEQKFSKLIRSGFTVIEWGGTKTTSQNGDLSKKESNTTNSSTTELNAPESVPAASTASSGHLFTDKNGEKIVFTDAEWAKLMNTWSYTGTPEEMISHHTIRELKSVLAMR